MSYYICSECGADIPDDSDFCYRCGALKTSAIKMDDDNRMMLNRCYKCGAETHPGDDFCKECGAPLIQGAMPFRGMCKNGKLALILSFIFGIVGIFGVGHLVVKAWARGFMFLAMSAIIWYVSGGFFHTGFDIWFAIQFAVYIYQLMDISRTVVMKGAE